MPSYLSAQDQATMDSLLDKYQSTSVDTSRILILNEIANQYHRYNPDTAILIADRALEWSERLAFQKGMARAFDTKGLGNWIKGNLPLALDNFHESLSYFESSGDIRGLALTLNNIGLIYYDQNDPIQARDYFQRSWKLLEGFKDPQAQGKALNNIGLTYEAQGDLKGALSNYRQGLAICEKYNLPSGIGQSLTNIGYAQYHLGNDAEALESLQQALKIQQSIRDRSTQVSTLIGLAQVNLRQKRYEESIRDALQARQLAINIPSAVDVKEATFVLYSTYKAQKDFDRALGWFERYKRLNDSIFSIENNKAIASLESKSALAQKQREIEALERQGGLERRLNYIVVAGLAAGCVLVFFLLHNRRQLKHANETLEHTNRILLETKKEVESQAALLERTNRDKDKIFSIVSHDLRSPMNSLKALISLYAMKGITGDEFRALIPDLSKRIAYASEIMEELLHWSRSQMNATEIHPVSIDIKALLNREVERFQGAARDKGIDLKAGSCEGKAFADPDMVKTVLRNLVNNAIKFCRKENEIVLSSSTEGAFVRINVMDTGTGILPENLGRLFHEHGFTTPGTANEKGTGLGLMLCKEFVEKSGGTISVESNWGKGTKFSFTLPVEKTAFNKAQQVQNI